MEKPDSRAGFTLLEMTIVLAVAALVFGIGALSLSTLKGRVTPHGIAEELADLMNSARVRSERDQSMQAVVIDLKTKMAFIRGGHQELRMPSDYSLSVIAGREIVVDEKAPEIRFLPDGSASGGEVVVSSPEGGRARVEVSWLTGLARIDDASQ